MAKKETEFKEGEECFYHEDFGQMKCKILEHELKDNDNELHLNLEVISVIKRCPLVEPPSKGHVFNVWKRLDCDSSAFWRITEIG